MAEESEVTHGSQFTNEELKKFDFRKLSAEQIETFEKLSFFSNHKQFYKILVDETGESKLKEEFIMDNLGYITQDDSA